MGEAQISVAVTPNGFDICFNSWAMAPHSFQNSAVQTPLHDLQTAGSISWNLVLKK
jgi:hypothetical protein